MTSERMIASNRSNGRCGRGPRTAAGKASSSRNALRHGLAASLRNKPAMCSDVEKLARNIAGAGADDAQLGRARIIAEAQLDLVRIRGLKVAVMNSFAAEANPSGPEGEGFLGEGCCLQEFGMTPKILLQLCKLDRYEGRAISRRRRAMRAFLVSQPFQEVN